MRQEPSQYAKPGGVRLGVSPGPEWASVAMTWPVMLVSRETEPGHWLTDVLPAQPRPPIVQEHLGCARCPDLPSVFCLSPDTTGSSYQVTAADMLAGILAHIRRSHPDVVAS